MRKIKELPYRRSLSDRPIKLYILDFLISAKSIKVCYMPQITSKNRLRYFIDCLVLK
jgi:hypothetical protein